jgi:SAM-dependent methyltransferase
VVEGYVTDVPYVRSFTRELAPAWLDHVALVAGFAPPPRDSGFAWCDLGCGHGVTAAILAATHPAGEFHGIDANPAHIESANRFAAESGIPNVRFHAAGFEQARGFDLPQFDYIVSHGVYSWVDEHARHAWRDFIDRHLKPGGLVYVSYNAMPGRAADLPLQRLVRTLGQTLAGDSQQRALAAIRIVLSMAELKAPALVASPLAARLKESADRLLPGYLAHELMGAHWSPLCVTEVRAALAPISLEPAGSATLMENYDSFVLGKAARATLNAIEDRDARELARDFLIDQFFRRDVFVRGGCRLDEEERRCRLLQAAFSLARAASAIEYHAVTPAGRLSFDNAAARRIVDALSGGPRRLAEIAGGSIALQDLAANALVLSAAGAIWPVEPHRIAVDRINETIFRRAGTPGEVRHVALPFGTAIALDPEILASRSVSSPWWAGQN